VLDVVEQLRSGRKELCNPCDTRVVRVRRQHENAENDNFLVFLCQLEGKIFLRTGERIS